MKLQIRNSQPSTAILFSVVVAVAVVAVSLVSTFLFGANQNDGSEKKKFLVT